MADSTSKNQTVDAKKEANQMLNLMNIVIKEQEKKQDKKRDRKFLEKFKSKSKMNGKQSEQKKIEQNPESDVSLVDQIFRPLANAFKGDTPIVSIDCEMVEVDKFSDGLARVSIVNYNGHILYDQYVKPEGRITNYRTWVSGITPANMNGSKPFKQAITEVHRILKGKIIVGHSLKHDFSVLQMREGDRYYNEDNTPNFIEVTAGQSTFIVTKDKIRDIAKYRKYQNQNGQAISLKRLTEEFLNRKIQQGSHCSVIDARAAMALYRINEQEWENTVKQKSYCSVKEKVARDAGQLQKFFGGASQPTKKLKI
ncbi:interferon-stimulated gene 20 kda protein [Stylonychia lemnae]|uniref:RNA exonuclease 4 n=1 Tax=Stylonychia lemnae TaxID=5949 RepID=A0A078ARC7_STYLE|nr:interferon-stimulated gene 20 kda protein [Stylonychia lemnae]|eukprot:CDW84774.1 interferon-stimulated gene 20 kda protein [Stylonychia lemnae]